MTARSIPDTAYFGKGSEGLGTTSSGACMRLCYPGRLRALAVKLLNLLNYMFLGCLVEGTLV